MSILPLKDIYWGLATGQALHRLLEIQQSRQTRSLPSSWKQSNRGDKIKQSMTNMMICVFLKNEDLQSLYCYLRFYTPFLGLEQV